MTDWGDRPGHLRGGRPDPKPPIPQPAPGVVGDDGWSWGLYFMFMGAVGAFWLVAMVWAVYG